MQVVWAIKDGKSRKNGAILINSQIFFGVIGEQRRLPLTQNADIATIPHE